jgi:hypothetical protein
LFGSEQPAPTETDLRATVSWPDDPDRLGTLNITFIHTPKS